MIIHNVAQLSDSWWEVRKGIPTASEFHRIIRASDGAPSKGMAGYIKQLVKDMVEHTPNYFSGQGKPSNVHTERGRDLEAEALEWYAFSHKVEIERVGFVTTSDGRFGASPDGFACKNGRRLRGLEVKCPEAKKMLGHVMKGVMPMTYKAQCAGGLVVCEDEINDWTLIEYCPEVTPFTVDIKPDWFTEALKVQLEAFDKLYSAVKAELGLKETKVTEADKIKAWQDRLKERPSMELLNSWLGHNSELSEITHKPAKAAIWGAVQAYVETQPEEWVFNSGMKKFVVKGGLNDCK